MEVGTGASPRVADLGDDVAPTDLPAEVHVDGGQVREARDDAVTVVDDEKVAEAALATHEDHEAVGRGDHGSAGPGGDVKPLVHLPAPRERRGTEGESGGEPTLDGPDGGGGGEKRLLVLEVLDQFLETALLRARFAGKA